MPPKRSAVSSSNSDEDGKAELPATRNRRLSDGAINAIVTNADLAEYDGHAHTGSGRSGTRSMAASTPSGSSSSISSSSIPQQQVIAQMQAMLTQFAAMSMGNSGSSSGSGAPSTAPSTSSGGNGSVNTGATDTVSRLISGLAPGGPLPTDNGDADEYGDEADDDEPAPPNNANDLRWNGIYVPANDRWAPSSISEVKAFYQSFRGRALAVRCKDIRSKHEVDTLSIICDAALAGRTDMILEIAVRRMVGVEDADANGGRDWDTATALDLAKPGALGTDELRRKVRKDAAHVKANRPKSAAAGNGSRTTAGRGGKWKGGSGGRGGGQAVNTATKR